MLDTKKASVIFDFYTLKPDAFLKKLINSISKIKHIRARISFFRQEVVKKRLSV
jgi:hypothetical protein